MQNIISNCNVVVYEDPVKDSAGLMMFLIFVGVIVIFIAIVGISGWLSNKKEKQNVSRNNMETETIKNTTNHSPNECDICSQPSGEYELCPECFERLQNGELSRCRNCGKWYIKGTICNCVKANHKETN